MSKHLEITLTSGCPMMCTYCPQSNYIKAYKNLRTQKKNMTLEDFKVILKNINFRTKNIHFTGFTEPTSNKEWYEIVKYTVEQGYNVKVNTTLHKADSKMIDQLVGLDITVNIHATDSKQVVPPEVYTEFASKYKKELVIDAFTEEGVSKVPEGLDVIHHKPQSRGDNMELNRSVIEGPVRCAANRQYNNVILPNGDVSVCCSDFSLKHILGNLMEQTLEEIHKSKEMKDFNAHMLKGDTNFICNNCFYAVPIKKKSIINRLAEKIK